MDAADGAGHDIAVRSVLHALKIRDRGWNEKRVIKLGVWGKESDEAAQAAFKGLFAGDDFQVNRRAGDSSRQIIGLHSFSPAIPIA